MTRLLYIEASPRGGRSASSLAARRFLDEFTMADPAAEIDHLDLWATDLPRFDGPVLDAKYAILNKQAHGAAEAAAWAAVVAAVDRLKAADLLLLAVPMWNFSVPYVLKHWIDIVTQPTLTFSFSPEAGYRGLVQGKRVAVLYASGGNYRPGSDNPRPDLQSPFVETWLRFIGITDIATATVSPTLGPLDRVAAGEAEGLARAAGLGRDFGQARDVA